MEGAKMPEARRAGRARKSSSVRGGATVTSYALNVLRRAGIRYKQSRGSIFRTTRTTIIGKGRKPKAIFPKARFKWLMITY